MSMSLLQALHAIEERERWIHRTNKRNLGFLVKNEKVT
jgi:hypothetical protein